MAMDLRFAFVCQKKWNELVGTDPIFRFCPECSRDIVNLDPMTEAAREKFFRDAQRAGMTPCVFATIRDPNITSCKDTLEEEEPMEEFPQLGGMPELDDLFSDDDAADTGKMFEDTK
jgi:hypothetical protein